MNTYFEEIAVDRRVTKRCSMRHVASCVVSIQIAYSILFNDNLSLLLSGTSHLTGSGPPPKALVLCIMGESGCCVEK